MKRPVRILREAVYPGTGGVMEMWMEQELRNETGHALVVADVGGGNEGAQNGTSGGHDGRGRNKRMVDVAYLNKQ